MKPLLSVVIPTKNRYDTLIPLIKVLSNFDLNMIEIVIQDNSDDNSLFLSRFKLNRNIKYYYCKKWLSVGENCDQAILNSSGEYVLFIGDDDAFSPEIIRVILLMKKYKIDSCFCNHSLYRWYATKTSLQYSFEYEYRSNPVEIPDLEKILFKSMKYGIQNKYKFPCVYHGIVRRTVLDKVYKKTGSYFPGPSPDMANAYSLAVIGCRHISIAAPVVIDGYSKASTGHLTEIKKHVGKLEKQSFLPKDTVKNWTKELPKVWLPSTIWPQSAIEAMKRLERTDYIEKINYSAIYIKISIMYPEFKGICRELARNYSDKGKMLKTFLEIGMQYTLKKFAFKGRKFVIHDCISIEEAININSELIQREKMILKLENKLERIKFKRKI